MEPPFFAASATAGPRCLLRRQYFRNGTLWGIGFSALEGMFIGDLHFINFNFIENAGYSTHMMQFNSGEAKKDGTGDWLAGTVDDVNDGKKGKTYLVIFADGSQDPEAKAANMKPR